jgi:5-amino-6-(5-phospho-D-ribitylamino)uracil phosphatase
MKVAHFFDVAVKSYPRRFLKFHIRSRGKFQKNIPKQKGFSSTFHQVNSRGEESSNFDEIHGNLIPNPLLRLEQLGTRWFGLIIELDCFLEENGDESRHSAWQKLAQKENLRFPSKYELKLAERVDPAQFISQIMLWSSDPYHIRELRKKYSIFALENSSPKTLKPGVHNFLHMLISQDIPYVVTSSQNRQDLKELLISLCIHSFFDVKDKNDRSCLLEPQKEKIAGCDDAANGLPDPEIYAFAANLIKRPINRCVVLGTSLHCCEAAHSLGMKCILLHGENVKRWELLSADIVKENLEEVFFQDFKELMASDIID